MPATAASQVFTSIRTVGGILPADMLRAIMAGGREVSASKPSDYHVVGSRTSVKDAAERHWGYLKGVWRQLRADIGDGGDPTGLAIENWLLPLFEEHGYGRLERVAAPGIPADDGDVTFDVTHQWRHLLVHLVPWSLDLEKRPVGGGLPPQSMVQDCLNRTSAHLWAVVSNGKVLRFLRDSSALTGSAYVEVDLEAMFDGELFDEFVLLYRLLHVSRFELPDETSAPSSCRMEKWRTEAIDSGTRFLNDISEGVRAAVIALGTGFLKHPSNDRLRQDFDADEYKRALLRLVYRLLFWFVAEERDLLHDDEVPESAKQRYLRYFSARRLRDASVRRAGGSHGDRWETLQFVFRGFAADNGLPELGLPGLGGIYDQTDTDKVLDGLSLSNEYLIKAVRSLSRVEDKSTRRFRNVDYEHLDSEELGAIYQSLLELIPNRTSMYEFTFGTALGNPRKGTGSYYTPTSLVDCLLDSSLDPVLDDARKQAETPKSEVDRERNPEEVAAAIAEAYLSVTVCDPACGSGHFLVAAARRIAKRVASVREGNPEPSEEGVRHALREAVSRCVYGVDLNPMAVELAKVSLWLEALEPGKALNFLDSKIKHGNGLIGATPALIAEGIPDSAFKPIEGDDKAWARSLLRANAKPPKDQGTLFSDEDIYTQGNAELAKGLAKIAHAPDGKLPQVHAQAEAYKEWRTSEENEFKRLVADAWCASFVWIKIEPPPRDKGVPAIVNRVFTDLQKKGKTGIPPETYAEIERLRDEYRFFHWHLEFPDIFHVPDGETEWQGGFTCILANPPWDKVDFHDKQYFSAVEPAIALLAGQKRRARILEWEEEYPEEAIRYRAARRNVKGSFGFFSSPETYPQCARGLTVLGVNSLQTDQLFTECFSRITASIGRVGCIVPTAIATAASAQYLFRDLTRQGRVASLFDFENRKGIFPAVDSRYKFCLLALTGEELGDPAVRFAFFVSDPVELGETGRVFALSVDDLALINPNTGTLPIFRSRRDAELTAEIYRRIPILWDENDPRGNPWGIIFKRMFDMTDDSDIFRGRVELERDGWRLNGSVFHRDRDRMLPLYEAKMIDFFNHRAADVVTSSTAVNRQNQPRYLTSVELQDPLRTVIPLSWIPEVGPVPMIRKGKKVKVPVVAERLAEVDWDREWLCGWCDVTSATNERTSIPAFMPRAAVGNTISLMFPKVSAAQTASLVALQSCLVFDFVSRQKIGSVHMQPFMWKQLPVPTPETMEAHLPFIVPRVLELVYTAYDMTPLARDLGDEGEPFVWDEDRRALLRAELDAFFFRLYGIDDRDDVDYILETFATETGGLKHNEIKEHGEYRTKRLVLEFYDRMSVAETAGRIYETIITPTPGNGPRHPARRAQ